MTNSFLKVSSTANSKNPYAGFIYSGCLKKATRQGAALLDGLDLKLCTQYLLAFICRMVVNLPAPCQ